eukprot:1677413-Rhodomonas_salina.3
MLGQYRTSHSTRAVACVYSLAAYARSAPRAKPTTVQSRHRIRRLIRSTPGSAIRAVGTGHPVAAYADGMRYPVLRCTLLLPGHTGTWIASALLPYASRRSTLVPPGIAW